MEKKLGRRRFNLEKFKDGGEENNNFLERWGDVRARGGQTEQRLDPKRPHRSSGGGAFEWARERLRDLAHVSHATSSGVPGKMDAMPARADDRARRLLPGAKNGKKEDEVDERSRRPHQHFQTTRARAFPGASNATLQS